MFGRSLNKLQMMQSGVDSKLKKINIRSKNNQLIFALSMIALQILISIVYSFLGVVPKQPLNANSVLTVIFFSFLVIVGFGLFIGNPRHLIWNGIGFSLLITALAIEVYPLVNAIWAKAHIHTNQFMNDSFKTKEIYLYLANLDSTSYENNTIPAAIKSALAIIIAFSSVIGRIGPLECLIMTVVGLFGYELNRSININLGQDSFGTFSIFAFGGFLGLTLGLFMALRQRNNKIRTHGNDQLVRSRLTVVTSLVGGIFIFILFPFLAYEGDQSLQTRPFHRYTTPICILLAMGSAAFTSIGFCMLIHGDNRKCIRVKDILNAIVAGGIACGAASYYITTPYLALIVGSLTGILQYMFDNGLEKNIYKKFGIISTNSFTLFCFQGFIGAIFAAAYNGRKANNNYEVNFNFPSLSGYGQQFVLYFVSSGFGIASGIVVGIPCYFLNKYRETDLFHDKTQFRPDDGIIYRVEKPEIVEPDKVEVNQTIPAIVPQEGEKEEINQKSKEPIKPPEEEPMQAPTEFSQDEFSFDFADMLQIAIQ